MSRTSRLYYLLSVRYEAEILLSINLAETTDLTDSL
jgi:hypothetical protein